MDWNKMPVSNLSMSEEKKLWQLLKKASPGQRSRIVIVLTEVN